MQIYSPSFTYHAKIPFVYSYIQAGFPSPATDYLQDVLDLNELLIKHPSSTFYVRATGNSMINAGIFHGDILVVDKSVEAKSGNIVIAIVNGEFTVKRLQIKCGQILLMPENDSFQEISVSNIEDFQIWGVVTSVVRQLNT